MEIKFQDVLLAAARKIDGVSGHSKSANSVLLPQRNRKQREKTEFASCASKLSELIGLLPSLESEINGDQGNTKSSDETSVLALREFATTCEQCNRLIADLQREVASVRSDSQLHEHREAIVETLQARFKRLCTLYNANASDKLKKLSQQHEFSKLSSSRAFNKRPREVNESGFLRKRTTEDDSLRNSINGLGHGGDFVGTSRSAATSPTKLGANFTKTSALPSWYAEADSVTEDEATVFENEFSTMYDERVSKMSEIRTLETQLSDIQRLQDVLAEHVLEQGERIDTTQANVVAATDNIKMGNEHLHRAMQNTARMRIWILFILLVCTFTLLFLHWYND